MHSRKTKVIYTLIIFITASIAFLSCCLILFINYDNLINWIADILERQDIKNLLKDKLFTQRKFKSIQQTCYIIIVVIPILVTILFKFRNKILSIISFVLKSLSFALKSILAVYRNNTKPNNIAILCLLFIVAAKSLYYIITWDLQYDEMWCYNYFTAQPLYFSFFTYSNYPLYEISTWFFKWLPLPMKINLRLPVLITGLAACLILYACLKKYFNSHFTALAGTGLFAFMPVTTFYMLYGRGVIFELLFAITALFSMLFWFRYITQSKYLVIYIFSNVLGLYSMPTHIYFWLLLQILGIIFCYAYYNKNLKKFLLGGFAIIALAATLYVPVLIGSGISFVVNATEKKLNWQSTVNYVPYFFKKISLFFTGSEYGSVIIIFGCTILLLAAKKTRHFVIVIMLSIALFFLPSILFIFQRFFIPERAFAFIGLAIPLIGSVLMQYILSYNKYFALFLISVVCLSEALISHYHNFLNWSRQSDKEAIELSNLFLSNHISTCYDKSVGSNFFYYYPAIEYYYRIAGKKISFTLAAQNSIRYKPLFAVDNYDCIVYNFTDKYDARFSNYKLLYKDSLQNFKILIVTK